jgi:hypothetical protein
MAVIKGGARSNGRQLGSYLLSKKDNESVRILEVDSNTSFTEQEFRDLLGDFTLNEQLTRSRLGLYHGIINPEEEYSRSMSDKDWQQAADILGEELGFTGQRRAIVLHAKHGRTHAHIAFERYHHETGKMLSYSHNYRKHDKARARIEQTFNQQPTPVRNPHRAKMKATLTKLWQEEPTATAFIKAVKQEGYMISNGFGRNPYMVVDDTGRSFPLVRHLDGIRLKEVRERFKDTVLAEEKDAIAFMRTQQAVTGQRSAKARQQTKPNEENTQDIAKEAFKENLAQMRAGQQQRMKGPRMK